MNNDRKGRRHLTVVGGNPEARPDAPAQGRESKLCNDIATDIREWMVWVQQVRADPEIQSPEEVIEARAKEEGDELDRRLREHGLK